MSRGQYLSLKEARQRGELDRTGLQVLIPYTSTRALAATTHRRHTHILSALAALRMPTTFRKANYARVHLANLRGYDIEMTKQGYLYLLLGMTTTADFRLSVLKEFV